MKQHWFIRGLRLIPALLLISSVTAAADTTWHSGTERNTLIELFTSQGCSSCPPAER